MTDLPKVITTLVETRTNSSDGTSTSRTWTKSPESDRPVMYNTNGFVETSLPHIRGAYFHVTNTTNEDGARRNAQFASCLSGSYFNSDVTFTSPVVGPNVSHLIKGTTAAKVTWTWPDINFLTEYLREAFPGMYRPGLCWDIRVTNQQVGADWDLDIQLPTSGGGVTVTNYGYNTGTDGLHNIDGVGSNCPSALIRTLVTDTTLGAEKFEFFVLHS